jgi:hypothetical protein
MTSILPKEVCFVDFMMGVLAESADRKFRAKRLGAGKTGIPCDHGSNGFKAFELPSSMPEAGRARRCGNQTSMGQDCIGICRDNVAFYSVLLKMAMGF